MRLYSSDCGHARRKQTSARNNIRCRHCFNKKPMPVETPSSLFDARHNKYEVRVHEHQTTSQQQQLIQMRLHVCGMHPLGYKAAISRQGDTTHLKEQIMQLQAAAKIERVAIGDAHAARRVASRKDQSQWPGRLLRRPGTKPTPVDVYGTYEIETFSISLVPSCLLEALEGASSQGW